MSDHYRVGRVAVWVDCVCGAEIHVPDAESDGVTEETIDCESCGFSTRLRVSVEVG